MRKNDTLARLRPQDHKILRLIACGYSRPEIAERLCYSTNSINQYKDRIYKALGVHNAAEAAVAAIALRLITVEEAWSTIRARRTQDDNSGDTP